MLAGVVGFVHKYSTAKVVLILVQLNICGVCVSAVVQSVLTRLSYVWGLESVNTICGIFFSSTTLCMVYLLDSYIFAISSFSVQGCTVKGHCSMWKVV